MYIHPSERRAKGSGDSGGALLCGQRKLQRLEWDILCWDTNLKMAKARQSETIAHTTFPLYSVRMIGERHFLVAGGGGQAKTGIPNAMVRHIPKILRLAPICCKMTRQTPVTRSRRRRVHLPSSTCPAQLSSC